MPQEVKREGHRAEGRGRRHKPSSAGVEQTGRSYPDPPVNGAVEPVDVDESLWVAAVLARRPPFNAQGRLGALLSRLREEPGYPKVRPRLTLSSGAPLFR